MPLTTNDKFKHLFRGRFCAVGTEEGGALRRPPHLEHWVEWWSERFDNHINGLDPIGVYPMVPSARTESDDVEWVVYWGCIDYDEGEIESLAHARNTQTVLRVAANIESFVEKSRSKGYHVWVFPNRPVPALTMRRALLAAAQVVGAPMKEINPKQVSLPWDEDRKEWKLGNYVRLPYPGADITEFGNRNVLSDNDVWVSMGGFIEQAWDSRCTETALDEMGKRFVEPPKRQRRTAPGNIDMSKPWKKRLDGLSHTLLYGSKGRPGGPYEDQDRSSWLWKLANSMIERADLNEDEMLQALMVGHDTYCPDKFDNRAEAELERMLNKALDQHE
jgi:hypothetical protein